LHCSAFLLHAKQTWLGFGSNFLRIVTARSTRTANRAIKPPDVNGSQAPARPCCSTVLMPRWFLPLACTANLAKNLAAVAASSTRAPIYRTFALQNNLADVTAKGGLCGLRAVYRKPLCIPPRVCGPARLPFHH
jgi:hypothetical protein